MKITQNSMFNNMRQQISSSSLRLLRAQEQMTTQKRINRLSDDPIDGGRVLDINDSISRISQYVANADRVNSLAEIQDTSLTQVSSLIDQAKKLLLQEANEATSTASTREATRIEIAVLTSQMTQVANTRFDGRYIFSGFATDTPAYSDPSVGVTPTTVTGGAAVTSQKVADMTKLTYHGYQIQFTAANQFNIIDTTAGVTVAANQTYTSGASISFDGLDIQIANNTGTPAAGDTFTVTTTPPGIYQGDTQVQEVEVQKGTRIQQNIPGNRIFSGVGVAGGVDIFNILNRINTALKNNDRTEISALLDELDTAKTQVSNEQSGVGSRINLIKAVQDRQSTLQSSLEVLRSNLEDIDLTEAMTNLSKQQTAYEATLTAASQVIQPSLLDFLS